MPGGGEGPVGNFRKRGISSSVRPVPSFRSGRGSDGQALTLEGRDRKRTDTSVAGIASLSRTAAVGIMRTAQVGKCA